ncbi:MAG: DUF3604 domain-containing protein, partial [Porticoccaceae bacterium]|nr:DUF3604 domain-containing protein [Porticoccaceae bacterium]
MSQFFKKQSKIKLAALLLCLPVASFASEKTGSVSAGDKVYSPYADDNFPQNAYFGEFHLHTSFSMDAGMVGNTLT